MKRSLFHRLTSLATALALLAAFVLPAAPALADDQTYTITYETGDGTFVTQPQTTYNPHDLETTYTDVVLPFDLDAPDGTLFAGWYQNQDYSGPFMTVLTRYDSGDKTFYAKYVPDTLGLAGGTAGTYEIGSLDDLLALSAYTTSGGDTTGMTFKQTADIDISAIADWAPIGLYRSYIPGRDYVTRNFRGTYDGQGHTISGLTITSDQQDYKGLFGSILNGSVKDLVLTDVNISTAYTGGGLAGSAQNTAISGCSVQGSLTGNTLHTEKPALVGGLVGNFNGNYGTPASVKNCSFSGTIKSDATAGGLLGYAFGSNQVSDCLTSAQIQSDLVKETGPAVGFVNGDTVVTNCYFDSDKFAYQDPYPDEDNDCTGLTTAQIANGRAAWLLNGSTSDEPLGWRQTIGTDDLPVPAALDPSRPAVYQQSETYYYNYGIPAATIDLTAPVKNAAPQTAIAQPADGSYTGAVTWTPTDDPFLADTAYTAVVTLTPAAGYAFTAPMTLNTASVDPAHTVWADTSDTADQTLAWSIAKATPTGAPAFDKVTAAGKALADVPLTIGSIQPADGSLAWDDPAQTTLERDKAYAWTFTPADTVNYTTLTGTAVPYTARSSSGGDGGGGGVSLHMVEVLPAQGGTVTVDKTPASRGATIHLTVTPDQGASLTSLTAKDASGKILSLTWDGNVASFSMPASKVTVTPVFSGGAAAGPFDDVQASDWFNDPVLWVNDRGLMTGTAARTFSPSMTTTRGMIVSVLNRLEGSPAPQSACSFLDVASGSWYENAIAWGAENGVVDGYSDTLFGPDDPITREQMAAMLHKYALYKGYDVPHPMT